MNAHHTTAIGIAAAIMNRPRVSQIVAISTTIFNGSPLGPRYVVLVTPESEKLGTVYECGRRALDQLRMGISPEELELEPFEPEPDDASGIPTDEELRRWHEGRVL